MFVFRKRFATHLLETTNQLLIRVQRLEAERLQFHTWIDSERQLRILTAHLAAAVQTAMIIGAAVERFAEAMRARPPRGSKGGFARARNAWRYSDGTFMCETERQAAIEELELEDYERYATGGRKRAATATRNADGTFSREHFG